MHSFKAKIEIIGANPFVFVPDKILQSLFEEFGKAKGPIPIKGTINGQAYTQTLVKYSGEWRLYINTIMLKNSPKRIGEEITISVAIDNSDRTIPIHPKLEKMLNENPEAKTVFASLPPSRRKEIVRYISFLKSDESIDKNVLKARDFLLGKVRFVGRENPENH